MPSPKRKEKRRRENKRKMQVLLIFRGTYRERTIRLRSFQPQSSGIVRVLKMLMNSRRAQRKRERNEIVQADERNICSLKQQHQCTLLIKFSSTCQFQRHIFIYLVLALPFDVLFYLILQEYFHAKPFLQYKSQNMSLRY